MSKQVYGHKDIHGSHIEVTMTDEVHGQVWGSDTEPGKYEDVQDLCEPCLAGDIKKPAVGWCETCDELLCGDCYQGHCRQKLMRNHQLKPLEDMKAHKQLKHVVTKCDTHGGEPLTYYCEDHKELGCRDCFIDKHRKCDNIVNLSGIKISETLELKTIMENMLKLEQRLKRNIESVVNNIDVAKSQYEITITRIEDAESNLKAFIEKLVHEIKGAAKKIRDTDMENMQALQSIHKELSISMATGHELVRHYTKSENERELFIVMKTVETDIKHVVKQLLEAEKRNCVNKSEFSLNTFLAKIPTEVKEFGTLNSLQQQLMPTQFDKGDEEFEVHRFGYTSSAVGWYHRRQSDAIDVTVNQNIRLLYVLLYPGPKSMTVTLNISEDGHDLVQCKSTHPSSGGDLVPVKVLQYNGDHGITLRAGHTYCVCTTFEGVYLPTFEGDNGRTAGGVKFTFADSSKSTNGTSVKKGQIPGLRFTLTE